MANVNVIRQGLGVFQFMLDDDAKAWVDENVQVDDYSWMGASSFVIFDTRCAIDIAQGMINDGLEVA